MSGNTRHGAVMREAELPAMMPRPRRNVKGGTRPESGHRSERRLRETIQATAIEMLATDRADRDRLGEMFEIVWEYHGRSPFAAACKAYHEGDREAMEIALADDRRLIALAGPEQ